MVNAMPTSPFSYQFYSATAQAWEAMHRAIVAAKKSIYWEVFIFVDDQVGQPFVDALADKARAGVEVKMIVDAVGSFGLSRAAEAKLIASGVEILRFNRLWPELAVHKWLSRLIYRNHRKVLIIDEETAFLGGVNVHAASRAWDDLYLRMEGRVVRPLLRGFAKSYISAGGPRAAVRSLLRPKSRAWAKEFKERFNFILHTPYWRANTPFKRFYLRGFATAKHTINLLTPYFVPDKQFFRALAAARLRGVKVNLFLPLRPDHKFLEFIARAYYELTQKLGVNIYFLPRMNHGKGMSIDDKAGVVGSFNLTPRGFSSNAESGVYFTDEQMVSDLNAIFNSWKEESQPFDTVRWGKRGWVSRLKEWWAKKFEDFV